MARTYRSFAKINLHLEVVGRRPDGFHDLRTVFQTVDLHDLLTVEAGEELVLRVEGAAPLGAENLVHRAATAFLKRWAPGAGAVLTLEKRIPLGGGLGGGSSDAATTLLALSDLLGVRPPRRELVEVARRLGADVPYFLVGGTALGLGRGDEVRPLPDLPEEPVWLVVPPVEVSTGAVFEALTGVRAVADPGVRLLLEGRWNDGLARLPGRNDLTDTVLAGYPEVAAVYNALIRAGASRVRLSGSGATVFAVFTDPVDGGRLSAGFPSGTRVIRARTLSRATLEGCRLIEGAEGG
jgi:4-diphosphocytidyl-2-C-methyl-D-erythritol kinase